MIEPLRDNVIIEPIAIARHIGTRLGEVVLPNRSVSDDHFGTICFVGPDVKVLKPGDRVVMPTWNDDELEVDGVKYIVLSEKAISVRISE